MDYNFTYSFPAVRGTQAGREYYVAMCPLKLIPKIFLFDEEEIPAEFRSQRLLNRKRIPEISNYIVENPGDYVFSALTASIDGEMTFHSFDNKSNRNIGQLAISMDAQFLINDGQHRRAAIEEAINMSPELGNETISVVFFHDQGLLRSQQLFADLNKHAVNTSKSISILYDSRDDLSILTKNIIEQNNTLRHLTDLENSSLSKFSRKVFTLSTIYSTNKRILNVKKGQSFSNDDKDCLISFWDIITKSIKEWNMVLMKEISAHELRTNYLNSYGIVLEAIGMLVHESKIVGNLEWKKCIEKLDIIDWTRSNKTLWQNRVFNQNGRINKNLHSIKLTKSKIKQLLSVPLTEEEIKLEQEFVKKELI